MPRFGHTCQVQHHRNAVTNGATDHLRIVIGLRMDGGDAANSTPWNGLDCSRGADGVEAEAEEEASG